MNIFTKSLDFARRASMVRLQSKVYIYTRVEDISPVTLEETVEVSIVWSGQGEVAAAQYVQDVQIAGTITAVNRAELRLPHGTVIPNAEDDRFAAVDGIVYRVIDEQLYDSSVWVRIPIAIDGNQRRFAKDLEALEEATSG